MSSPVRRFTPIALLSFLLVGCGEADPDRAAPPAGTLAPTPDHAPPVNSIAALLDRGEAVFGIFSGPKSREGGAAAWGGVRADFQLYSMESGPFDVATMGEYMAGMADAGGEGATATFPLTVRTPPIHTRPDQITGMVEEARAAGISGFVFPHVTTAAEAARSVELIGRPWPLGGESVNILIIEDREGIANAREIMRTPGLSVVFAGPGDLRRAYEGDMEAVEAAIQTVLEACLEFDVPCGVTAGVADIARRLDEGFEVIIVTEPEAVAVGMEYVGRIE
ncbi:MAG: aldolase/citrate lyase family protein [Longimicrobiales bacterium]|nr:aldolase/citrate lyase family protein [Longimicrobiales bacterium]